MEGKKEIIEAIKAEYDIGLSRLPAYGFSYMFKEKVTTLTESSLSKMKHWLSIVKQGSIVYDDPNRIEDEFFTKGSLYKALDLHELNDDDIDMDF